MIGITLFLLPIMSFMAVRVCKMVWANEKIVPLMLVTLCMTLIALVAYWSFLIRAYNAVEWSCNGTKSYNCAAEICDYLPAVFLANAVVLNLNKWVYFKMRINAFINVGFGQLHEDEVDRRSVNTASDSSLSARMKQNRPMSFDTNSNASRESAVLDLFEQENENLKKKQKINNIACIILAGGYTVSTLSISLYPCVTGELRFLETNHIMTSAMFCVLGIFFLIYGVSMNISLRKHFPGFYNRFWCFLWTASFCLTIPLFLRAFINGLLIISPKFFRWYNDVNNFSQTNTLYLVFTTYIPIMTQISSLTFGYLRKKQDAKKHARGELGN